MKKLSFFLFTLLFVFSPTLRADISVKDLAKKIKLPSAEWKKNPVDFSDKEFLNIEYKKLGKTLTISGRTDDIPMDAKSYLDQIRTYLIEDKKNYENARITPVAMKTAFGKDWQVVEVKAPDGLQQELWCRKLGPTQVLLFLYTSIGESFQNFHGDFDKILEQGGKL